MNDLHCLYTNGQDVLRIVKYFPPTPDADGYYQLERDGQVARVWRQEFLTKWKVFNSAAAFADYLLYTDEILKDYREAQNNETTRHMMMWTKGRCLEVGKVCATPIMYSDLLGYF